jgi:chaperonin GroEL
MGAQLIKEAATKTNDIAGDGTTTSTLLAHSIVTEASRPWPPAATRCSSNGHRNRHPKVSEKIKGLHSHFHPPGYRFRGHHLSPGFLIGELIADVMDKVGKDGVITVEESKGLEFEKEYVEGMQFDRGYISSYFITDTDKMESVIPEPYILIYDKKISAAQDIVPILEKLVQTGKRDLVIIAEDIDGEPWPHWF